jgi:hypothetical protein
MNAHVDVAAYALGAMDDREASQFEDHLVGCATCSAELESMVSVVALLADVTLADVTGEAPVGPYTAATGIPVGGQQQPPVAPAPHQTPPAPPVAPAPQMPQRPQMPAQMPQARPQEPFTGPSLVPGAESGREDWSRRDERRDDRHERQDDRRPAAAVPPPTGPTPISRARSKRRRGASVLLAAAAAVVGAVGGGAAVAQSGYFQEQAPPADQAFNDTTPRKYTDAVYSNTDKKTGAHVDANLVSRPWGTNVAFTVTKIRGPKECRLVAVRQNGETEVLSTWTVPDGGYGFKERPQPLSLETATSLVSDDITHLKVQELDDDGDPSTLVTVRV